MLNSTRNIRRTGWSRNRIDVPNLVRGFRNSVKRWFTVEGAAVIIYRGDLLLTVEDMVGRHASYDELAKTTPSSARRGLRRSFAHPSPERVTRNQFVSDFVTCILSDVSSPLVKTIRVLGAFLQVALCLISPTY